MKINIGCSCRPIDGYVNIDMDSKEDMQKRYPDVKIPDDIKIYQYDIFNLPYEDNELDEVRCDCVMEHFSFKEEKLFWHEVHRVLKPGGLFNFSVPDFDFLMGAWLKAKDNWKEFYRDDDEAIQENHWFGQKSHSFDSKWGYLLANIFGSQNGDGQYHKNAYTVGKIKNICKVMKFSAPVIEATEWKTGRPELILKVNTYKK